MGGLHPPKAKVGLGNGLGMDSRMLGIPCDSVRCTGRLHLTGAHWNLTGDSYMCLLHTEISDSDSYVCRLHFTGALWDPR